MPDDCKMVMALVLAIVHAAERTPRGEAGFWDAEFPAERPKRALRDIRLLCTDALTEAPDAD